MKALSRLFAYMVCGIVLVMALVPAMAVYAAPPGLPHRFYGSVTVGGATAPDGTQVTANIDTLSWPATTSGGKYGWSTPFLIPADNTDTTAKDGGVPGDTIVFKVAGTQVATAVFANGGNSQLDLAVNGPPAITTSAATGITETTAVLNGNLTSTGGSATVNVSFEWGASTSYGNSTNPQTLAAPGAFSETLTGLAAGSTYHFRTMAVGGSATVYGPDAAFTTQSGSVPGPAPRPAGNASVNTAPISNLAANSVRLNGNLVSLGGASSVQVSFEWGASTSYGKVTPAQNMTAAGDFSETVTGLTPATVYYFRPRVVGPAGESFGAGGNFTTPSAPVAPLAVVASAPTQVTTNSATLNGKLTGLGGASSVQVSFEWGASTSYGNATPARTMSAPGDFSATVTGLSAGTTYHYRAKVGTAYSDDRTLTTPGTSGGPPPVPGPVTPPAPVPSAAIRVNNMTVVPGQVGPGQVITIIAAVVNEGSVQGKTTLVLRLNTVQEERREVTLGPGETQPVTFQVTRDRPGTYSAEVGGRTATFTVVGGGGGGVSMPLAIGIAVGVVALIAAGAGVFLLRKHK